METDLLPQTVISALPPAYSEDNSVRKQEIYAAFIEFESLPDPDKAAFLGVEVELTGALKGRYKKIPKLIDFARKYGVHQNTLTAWRRREDFAASVEARQKEWGIDLMPNVMASLYRRCVRYGISSDVELFLAYYKNWDRKQVIKHQVEKFDENDIRALLAMLPKEEQDKYYATLFDIIDRAKVLGSGGKA